MMSLQVQGVRIQDDISKEHNCTRRTVRRDIMWVEAKWDEDARRQRPAYRHKMRETLRVIMRKAMAARDWKAAIAACDRIMKLDGLNAPLKIEASTKVEHRVELMTSDQQRKRLFSMIEQAGFNGSGKGNGKGNGDARPGNGSAAPN
jgi:hypothetical protein